LLHAAIGDCPDRFRGYSAIDNANALRLCAQVSDSARGELVHPLARTYFECLQRSRRDDGRVYHVCDRRGIWTAGGDDVLIQSCLARALAAVLVSELPIDIRLRAADWWRELLPHADDARSPRAAANWLIAIGQLHSADPGRDLERVRTLANWLVDECFVPGLGGAWGWFGSEWETTAACIPHGLWLAGQMLDEPRYTAMAESCTDFLLGEFFDTDLFVPPGTRGGWQLGSDKALYDQQPADTAAVVELLCVAEQITGRAVYGERAELAARWFAGHNLAGVSLIDAATGGCHDALTSEGPHPDQGGTAVVAYLLTEAARALRAATQAEPPVYMVAING